MSRRPFPFATTLIGSMVLLFLTFVVSILVGAGDISLVNVFRSLFTSQVNDQILIIREIRLPREVAALFVGAALAVSGAIMQGMTRNPLADPGLLGLTAGANMALAIVLAFAVSLSFLSTIVACFVGAAIGAGLVFGIGSMRRGGFSPVRLVLAGAAVSAFLYAMAQGIAIHFRVAKDVSMWTSGGFIGSNWDQLSLLMPIVIVCILLALLLSKQITIMSLSEEVATGLGQNIALLKMMLFLLVVMLAGVSVAVAGNLIFVGLLVPHIARKLVGVDYQRILPLSAIVGAIFMLAADTVARVINAPFETSVAAVVAVLGLPFFLWIVNRGGDET